MSKGIKVRAIIEDEEKKTFSVILSFSDITRKRKSIIIPRAQLSNPRKLIEELENYGARLPRDCNKQLLAKRLCKQADNAPQKLRVASFGWQRDGSFVSFKFNKVKGSHRNRLVAPSSPFASHLHLRGTLGGWKKTVACNAKYSSPMVLSICAAFAAATLKLSDIGTFGFMLVGPTKIGKSAVQLAAGSVIGFAREQHLPNFRNTEAALEELTASFSDHILIANEGELIPGDTKEARARMLRSFAYRLAEGQSKGFSRTLDRPRTFYRTIFIGSIENPSMPQDRVVATGSEVRLFDIAAASNGRSDVFDRVPKRHCGTERAKWAERKFRTIRNGCQSNSGVAYSRFIKELVKDPKNVQIFLNKESQCFLRSAVPPDCDAAVRHIAKYFSHVAAAGLLAAKLGIVPWSCATVRKSVRRCLKRALRNVPTEAVVLRQAVDSLRAKFGDGVLLKYEQDQKLVRGFGDAAGYFVESPQGRLVTMRAQELINIVGSQETAFRLLRKFSDAGLLLGGAKSKTASAVKDFETQQKWPDGSRPRSVQIIWDAKKILKAVC